jgi:hypothetical protein
MGPTTILILGGALALVLLVIGLIVTATEERSLVDDRLEYLEEEGVEVVPRKAVIGEWVGKQATRFTWGRGIHPCNCHIYYFGWINWMVSSRGYEYWQRHVF